MLAVCVCEAYAVLTPRTLSDSAGGYCSEATAFAEALNSRFPIGIDQVWLRPCSFSVCDSVCTCSHVCARVCVSVRARVLFCSCVPACIVCVVARRFIQWRLCPGLTTCHTGLAARHACTRSKVGLGAPQHYHGVPFRAGGVEPATISNNGTPARI